MGINKKSYHKFDVTGTYCLICGVLRMRNKDRGIVYEYAKDLESDFNKEYINCKPKINTFLSTDSRNNPHRWERINGMQSRCRYCKCLRTLKRINGNNSYEYQDVNSMIHNEYLICIDKPDNSEFYK